MTANLYFENIVNIGNLYIEYVFLDFYKEPIFFTCVDDQKQLYICLCSEIRGEQRWIITKSNINILQEVVDGKMDMATAFKMNSTAFVVERTIEEKEDSFVVSSQDIDPLDLPKEGTLLRCNQTKAMNYLTNKKFEMVSSAINNMFEMLYVEKENRIYNMIIGSCDSLGLVEKSISSNVLQEFLSSDDNRYEIEKRIPYQSNDDKNDVESINNEYLFAA